MITKKVIIISAATFFALNFLVWLLGWLIWPLGFLVLWGACGRLAIYAETLEGVPEKRFDNYDCYLFGPIGLIISLIDSAQKGRINPGKYIPKIRNPFVWKTHD